MNKIAIRTRIDFDTRRSICMAARRRSPSDIARVSQVDFVAGEVMKRYGLSRQQIQGTELGREIDRLGEELRQEMLRRSLQVVQIREAQTA